MNKMLGDFEKIQFMQFEYDWQKKRLDDLYNKSNLLLCWNAAVFTFAIAFTDITKVVDVIKDYKCCPIISGVVISITMVFISIVLLGISTIGFFNCAYMKKLMCFNICDNIDHNFDVNEIVNDYKTIIVDYDSVIDDVTKKLRLNIVLMVLSVSMMLIFELVLKILVSIV